MLCEKYLIMGLDGLSRASEHDYFRDGHLAASVIAAYYLCRENGLNNQIQNAIKSHIDRELRGDDIFTAAPNEEAVAPLIARLSETLSSGASDLREVGHNIIFGAAALKAFQRVPHAITPFRVEGICRLITSFNSTQNVVVENDDKIPGILDEDSFVEFIFREYLRSVVLYEGFGQGWAGHSLTFGHAVIELSRLGYPELAAKAHQAFRMYVKTMRRGPKETDKRYPEHPRSDLTPLDLEYWERRKSVRSGIGHVFKYAYSFYNLISKLENKALRQHCLAESYRIF